MSAKKKKKVELCVKMKNRKTAFAISQSVFYHHIMPDHGEVAYHSRHWAHYNDTHLFTPTADLDEPDEPDLHVFRLCGRKL